MTVQTFQSAAPVPGMPDGAAMLAAWAQTASSAAGLVSPLVDTPFVPDHFRAKVDPRATDEEKAYARQVAVASATAAVLYGAEIGLSPMQALQGVLVIKGKVGMYAATMVALVQAAGHEVWTEDSTDTRVIVCGRRAGTQAIERQVWTIERAKQAGYLSNEKYKTDPQAMLWARAASVVCRRIAQDVLKGITASSEEIVDEDSRANPPKVTSRTVQRAPRPELAAPAVVESAMVREARASVALDGETQSYPLLPDETPTAAASPAARAPQQQEVAAEVGPAATSPDVERTITDKQWRDINAAFVKLGVTGPGQSERRLAVLSDITARPIARGSELSEADANLALSMLTAEEAKQYVRDVLVDRAITPTEGIHQPEAVEQQAAAEATYQGQADAQVEAEQTGQPEQDLEPQLDDPWNGQGGE